MLSKEELATFKNKLLTHSGNCINRMGNCSTEEATKQSLILPFIELLGYDIFNTLEVIPEHQASFADKYKNRVDYAITKEGKPSIAMECKKVGTQLDKTDRGQLRSYFNAIESVKIGVLTDGIKYEFFADCDSPNMMDEMPFIKFDLKDISVFGIKNEQLEAIACFLKSEFDSERIGGEAKRKLVSASICSFFETNFKHPSEEFIRFILSNINAFKVVTKKVIDDNRPLIISAASAFVDKEILNRVGISQGKNASTEETEKAGEKFEKKSIGDDGIITTKAELDSYNYAVRRLAFLADSEELFNGLKYVRYVDYKTTFVVYYKSSKLFSLNELEDGKLRFFFPAVDREIITKNLSDTDEVLLLSYKLRVNPPDVTPEKEKIPEENPSNAVVTID
jgi:hypothetical protein